MQPTRQPLTESDLIELGERNKQRLPDAIARLGKRYTLHPSNSPQRLTQPQRCHSLAGSAWC